MFAARRGGLHRPAPEAVGGRARPRDADARTSRSVPPCAAASRSSGWRAPGRSSTGATTSSPRTSSALRARRRAPADPLRGGADGAAVRATSCSTASRGLPRAGAAAGARMGGGRPRRPSRERPAAARSPRPRRRFVGVRFGQHRSPRRGRATRSPARGPTGRETGRTWIDWRASARLSAARGTDEFVVREFFADTAPRVALAVDRRPRDGSSTAPPFPWLDKAAAVRRRSRRSAARPSPRAVTSPTQRTRERAPWLAPKPAPAAAGVLSLLRASPSASPCRRARSRGASTCSSAVGRELPGRHVRLRRLGFVEAAPPRSGVKLRALRVDVVPVVVQDPVWEHDLPTHDRRRPPAGLRPEDREGGERSCSRGARPTRRCRGERGAAGNGSLDDFASARLRPLDPAREQRTPRRSPRRASSAGPFAAASSGGEAT